MKFFRYAVVVATAALLPFVPSAAQADKYTHTDATNDVFSTTGTSGTLTPAPDRATGDVISSLIKHKRRTVILQLRYNDLVAGGDMNVHYFVIRTSTMRRNVALVAAGAFPGGRVQMTKPNGKNVNCRVRHSIDYTLNTATVVVPRSCLGFPKWVKVGMAGLDLTGLAATDTEYVDDALSAGSQGVYSPRVYR